MMATNPWGKWGLGGPIAPLNTNFGAGLGGGGGTTGGGFGTDVTSGLAGFGKIGGGLAGVGGLGGGLAAQTANPYPLPEGISQNPFISSIFQQLSKSVDSHQMELLKQVFHGIFGGTNPGQGLLQGWLQQFGLPGFINQQSGFDHIPYNKQQSDLMQQLAHYLGPPAAL